MEKKNNTIETGSLMVIEVDGRVIIAFVNKNDGEIVSYTELFITSSKVDTGSVWRLIKADKLPYRQLWDEKKLELGNRQLYVVGIEKITKALTIKDPDKAGLVLVAKEIYQQLTTKAKEMSEVAEKALITKVAFRTTMGWINIPL